MTKVLHVENSYDAKKQKETKTFHGIIFSSVVGPLHFLLAIN